MTSTKSVCTLCFSASLLLACNGSNARVDGAQSRMDVSAEIADAGVLDATGLPDAIPCSLVSPPPPPVLETVNPLLDVEIDSPVAGADWMAGIDWVFANGTTFVLFNRFYVYVVDSGAMEITRVPLPSGPEGPVRILSVAQGALGYGASVLVAGKSDPPDVRFCVFGFDGMVNLAGCPSLADAAAPNAVPVTAIPGGFASYRVSGGMLSRGEFSDDGSLVGITSVGAVPTDVSGVLSPTVLGGREFVIDNAQHTEGCRSYWSDSFEPSGLDHRRVDLLPADFIATVGATAAVGSDSVFALYSGRCTAGGVSPCAFPIGREDEIVLMTTFDMSGVAGIRSLISVPASTQRSLVWDGSRMTALVRGSDTLQLVHFASDGSGVGGPMDVPGIWQGEPWQLLGAAAFAATGSDEYIIGYGLTSGAQEKIRLLQVTVSPI